MGVQVLNRGGVKPAMWPVSKERVAPEWAWFWNKARSVLPFWEGGGTPIDILRNYNTTFNIASGGAPIWDQDKWGRRLTAHADGSEVDLDASIVDIVGGNDFFIAAMWRPTDAAAAQTIVASNADLTHNLGMNRGYTGNIYARAFGAQIQNSASFYAADDVILAVFSVAGPSGAMALECRNLTTGARSRNTGTAGTTVPAGITRILRRSANVYEMAGSVYWVALGRGLPTNEALTTLVDQLGTDPLGPIRPTLTPITFKAVSAPDYAGDGALILAAVLLAGVGVYTPPVYAGDGGVTLAPIALVGTGVYEDPSYQGDGGITFAPIGLAGTGVYTPPDYAGDGGLSLAPVGLAGTGVFAPPDYEGAGGLALAPVALGGSGTFAPPVYTGTGGLLLAPVSLGGTGVYVDPPTYTGDGGLVLAPITFSGVGLHSLVYSGVGGLRMAGVGMVGAGAYAGPPPARRCFPIEKAADWLGIAVGGTVAPLVTLGIVAPLIVVPKGED